MSEAHTVKASKSSTLGLLLSRGLQTAAEAIGISYAIAIGPTLYERFQPMVGHIQKSGFEKGWAEGTKAGWVAPTAEMMSGAMAGRITANIVAGGMEMMFRKKLTGGEKILSESMGAFVAVGMQVGTFSGAGFAAIMTPPGMAALATYAVASAATSLALFLVKKPFQSLANYSRKAMKSESPSAGAPAMAPA
jgi:hypothetical protein